LESSAGAAAATWARWRLGANRFTLSEIAGAFGDLGTLIPFLVGYLAIVKLDPSGVLLGFGVCLVAVGLFYRTPVPVQPMKALGATAITQRLAPGTVVAAGFITGLVWLVLGLTGAVRWIAALAAKPVVRGILLGLGLSFVISGVKDIAADPVIGGVGMVLTFLLLECRFPVMLVLLLFGVAAGLATKADLWRSVAGIRPAFTTPSIGLNSLTYSDLFDGALLLALPQLPLTMGNAVIGVTAEHNRLFPDRRISERLVAVTTGLMNGLSAAIGGIPLCHGAGGLAGHVRFGARTGGGAIVLGLLLVVAGLFFRDSVQVLLALFPQGVLGVILCFAGLALAGSSRDLGEKEDATVSLLTAGFAIYHMGLAFLVGIVLHAAIRRRWVKV
jgi:predicted benzoate:H+ symporter BenE